MRALFVGVDPGQDGGLVVLDERGQCLLAAAGDFEVQGETTLPLTSGWAFRGAKGHPAVRISQVMDRVPYLWVDARPSKVWEMRELLVYVEHQQARGRQGGQAKHTREQGIWEGVATMLPGEGRGIEDYSVSVVTVDPGTWRKDSATSAGDYKANKAASVAYCRGRLPSVPLLLSSRHRAVHTGIADAAVIADCARRRWLRERGI